MINLLGMVDTMVKIGLLVNAQDNVTRINTCGGLRYDGKY